MVESIGAVRGLGKADHADTIRALLHDLRGPVAAIANLAGLPGEPPERRMQAIEHQAAWLHSLIEVALADGGHDDLDIVEATEAAERAADIVRPLTGAQLTVHASARPAVWARPVALGRALACVLDNAGRAAGPAGHIEVHVDADLATNTGVIRVVDDGPGPGRIAAQTSLGLTTTRAMTAACEGSFRLYPRPGGGTVAGIRLSLAQVHQVAG
jgi:signal transduction histidine kinase